MRVAWNAVAMVGLTALYSVPPLLVVILGRWWSGVGPWLTRWASGWSRTILWACGVRVQTQGFDQPLEAPAYLVLANHTSHFDVLALYAYAPIDLRPVAKRELGRIPLFGWLLSAGAAIMVDRGNSSKAQASIAEAGETIRSGRSVLMFPEGTRSAGRTLGPFKKGPFYLAEAAQVPILPVVVEGADRVLKPHDWKIYPGTIRVRAGTPITTPFPEGKVGRSAMAEEVRKAMQGLLESFDPA